MGQSSSSGEKRKKGKDKTKGQQKELRKKTDKIQREKEELQKERDEIKKLSEEKGKTKKKKQPEELQKERDEIKTEKEELRKERDEIKREKEELQQERNEIKRLSEVDVTLDKDTAHCKLKISDDGKEVQWIEEGVQNDSNEGNRFEREPFVLGTVVRSWRSYWEVCVEEKEDWVLGVALDSVSREGQLAMCPCKGFWVIRLSNGRSLKALTQEVEVLTDIKPPSKVGIYLDCKKKQVSFYSVDGENLSHIYTFTNGPVYERAPRPIFSPWNNDAKPLTVLSIAPREIKF